MRLTAAFLLGVMLATPVAAQDRAPSASEQPGSTASQSATPDTDEAVSLERIREALQRPHSRVLEGLNRQADFSLEIEEEQKMEDLLKWLDVKSGPVPAGGLYMYEQQRRLFNPTERPLQQPYAAFSGAQLITIALQNLIARYVAKPLVQSAMNANRTRQQQEARDRVLRDIAAYCATRPDRWQMELCNPTIR